MTEACLQTRYRAEDSVMVFKETKIKNIKEVTEPLKEEILKGTRLKSLVP